MRALGRAIKSLVVAFAMAFAAALLYQALFANVPTARIEFTVPNGTSGDVTTPLEPMDPRGPGPLCDVRPGGLWRCKVRQTFWQNPFAMHKTGRITLGVLDPRACHRPGRAPAHLRSIDPIGMSVEAIPLPDEGCTARWTLEVHW